MPERDRTQRRYVVREQHVGYMEYEVDAASKAAAIEKAKAGEVVLSAELDVRPTGKWEADRV